MTETKFHLPKLGRLTVKLKDNTYVTYENVAMITAGTGFTGKGGLSIHIMAPKQIIYRDGEWVEFNVERQE